MTVLFPSSFKESRRAMLQSGADVLRNVALVPELQKQLSTLRVRYVVEIRIVDFNANIRLPLHPIILPAGVWWEEDEVSIMADVVDLSMLEDVEPTRTTVYGEVLLIQWVFGVLFYPMLETWSCKAISEQLHQFLTTERSSQDSSAAVAPDYNAWRREWLQKAADNGDTEARGALDKLLLEHGDGVKSP
ncbi:hypothetical protein [Defluviicoccus vanus]|uniref:hypothetical protein n=1 Tax=Defluviicoccus vanus TaxID=111831 RepID=UPI001CBA6231|nr:hypothetical protein [Defluviicoccus vanus]